MIEVIRVSKRDFIQNTSKYLKAGVIITHRGVDQLTVQNVATTSNNVATKAIKNVATKKDKPENVATNKTIEYKADLSDNLPAPENNLPFTKEDVIEVLHKVDRIPKTYNSERYGCGCAKSEKYLCGKHGRI